MSKILLFSDIHITAHKKSIERMHDCLAALEWVFKTREQRGIKDIVFLGDMFHDRDKIDIFTYQRAFELFEKHCSGSFNLYLLLGNHDLWFYDKWDISSVVPLRALPGVTIIDRPCTLEIAGHPISFLPYTHNPIADLQAIKNDAKYKILCGHLAVHGASLNAVHNVHADVSIEHDGEMQIVDVSVFAGWDNVFLGHYHGCQKLSETVEYLGSPLQLTFGEAFQHKQILVFDVDSKEKEYIRNNFSPTHLIIPNTDVEKYDLNNKFVRVFMEEGGATEVVELRNNLLTNNNIRTLKIDAVKKEVQEHLVADARAILLKKEEMIVNYIKEIAKADGLNGLDENKLVSMMMDMCNKANAGEE